MWMVKRRRRFSVPGLTALGAALVLAATELYAGFHFEARYLFAGMTGIVAPC